MDSAATPPWMKVGWKGGEKDKKHDGEKDGHHDEKHDDAGMPAWTDPTNPRCGMIKPWSEHKPYEVVLGPGKDAKESQCKACKIRACNAGLPKPEETGGCQCISYKDAAGNYATDCKNLLNKNLDIEYETCGAVRDCDALEGQCVSATFKMDSAATPPWMKGDWKGGGDEKKKGKSGAMQLALAPVTAVLAMQLLMN